MTANIYTSPATTAMTAFTTLLNGGTMAIFTGAQPAVNGAITGTTIVTMALSSTAFGAPSVSGSTLQSSANAIASGTATSTNTAGYYALFTSSGGTVATGTCATSGGDLNLSSLLISDGAVVSCSAYQVQLPL